MAISSRNPLHILAGANDYRSVDLPFVNGAEETGDAWLGVFTSYDGGGTWSSTLLPGYPQDTAPPLHGYQAAADPVVRAGPAGTFFYTGVAFDRNQGRSTIFVARYIDDNNLESGNSIRYLGTNLVALSTPAAGDSPVTFLDKPTIVIDQPRSDQPRNPTNCPAPMDNIPAFSVYVAYTQFKGTSETSPSRIEVAQSIDCGQTWNSAPRFEVRSDYSINQGAALAVDPLVGALFVYWRIFKDSSSRDAIAGLAFKPCTETCPPGAIDPSISYFALPDSYTLPINAFDQGTGADPTGKGLNVAFRTNDYPSVVVGNNADIYVAWSQLDAGGVPRVTLFPMLYNPYNYYGVTVSPIRAPFPIDSSGLGPQIMPALAYSSGQLTAAWYDFRNDYEQFVYSPTGTAGQYSFTLQPYGPPFTIGSQYWSPYVTDLAGSGFRHLVDVRAVKGVLRYGGDPPGLDNRLGPSILVSQYAYGSPAQAQTQQIAQLEFAAPNLPMFQGGTAPFIGDYIDVAGPTFLFDSARNSWRANLNAGDPDNTHIVWTDNRDVIQPADGNWTRYTPVALFSAKSTFDPTQTTPSCIVGQTGTRNQNIYTATLSGGLIMGAPGNAKPLSSSLNREFAVLVQNTTTQTTYYQVQILNQPAGGAASFVQKFAAGSPVTTLNISVPPLASTTRSIFVTGQNATESVQVTSTQIDQTGNVLTNGLTASTILNPDPKNPTIMDPSTANPKIAITEVYNPSIANPSIANPSIANPSIANPSIANPSIANPSIANPSIANPSIANPSIANPSIANPSIANPSIANPSIANAALSDANYIVTNTGNTTASYVVELLQNLPTPSNVNVQLVVSAIYTTPIASGCTLTTEAHFETLVNNNSPTLLTSAQLVPPNPLPQNADVFLLAPGQQAQITIRVYDYTTNNNAVALQHYNPTIALTPIVVSTGVNTNSSSNVPAASLTVTTATLPPGLVSLPYQQTLTSFGGTSPYTWRLVGTSSVAGLTLTSAGSLQGSPRPPFNGPVTVQVTDNVGNTTNKTFYLSVNPMSPFVGVTTSSLTYNQSTKIGSQTYTIKNTSATPIAGPIVLVLALKGAATAVNNAGTYNGNPYWRVAVSYLAPNASIDLPVTWSYSPGTIFSTQADVYSGLPAR
ncbi:MAG: hypothetical protein ACJ746_20320 [Bryobacteraceae bacterium]